MNWHIANHDARLFSRIVTRATTLRQGPTSLGSWRRLGHRRRVLRLAERARCWLRWLADHLHCYHRIPRFLTTLHPPRRPPYVALVTEATIGLALAFGLHFAIGDERLGPVLINLACFGALVSPGFQLTAFIQLRIREPDRERPYRSPFGVIGAVVSLALCAFV
ncbi:TPA: hypothetical protein N0F65_009113 [Lagenidium giganteum]|uniref:Uncharacterized protein n=1 Tax=Lagenidium giganteum TaxID=4803 RepID=A0AAV2YQA2_9STRA|nr:TPA: hypothetical protein N0F65_009113 [Lagenidium giganteum]